VTNGRRHGMRGRTCVVTGASAGIGEATVAALAAAGADVVMVARDEGRAIAARDRIVARTPSARLRIELADLADLGSTRALSTRLTSNIDVLVLDAGTTTKTREITADGLERILAVDFLVGSFALTIPLIPKLRPGARIVQLAGIYHRHGHIDLDDLHFEHRAWTMASANAQAQLARVVWIAELAERLRPAGIVANAVHPGAVLTDAQRDAPWWARALIHTVARPAFVHADRGAEPVIHLACDDELAMTSGRFFNRARATALPPAAEDRALRRALWDRAAALTGVDSTPIASLDHRGG
jgi:NAD(P)-dependent dehydrogenase (short-subunit alcohol dehydrogenase family)